MRLLAFSPNRGVRRGRAAGLERQGEGKAVAKAEWGAKRICPSCGTRYYDLNRDPVLCPKCGVAFDPEAFLRSRRARPAAPAEKELEPVAAEGLEPDLETEEPEPAEAEDEEAVPLADDEEEESEEVLEDASDLGEDDDDMAEVIDNVEDEEH
jgi:uncharacterized protein (TIGR02300 family)